MEDEGVDAMEIGIAGGCCPHLFRFEGPDAMLFAFSDVESGVPDECRPRAVSFTGRNATVTSQAP